MNTQIRRTPRVELDLARRVDALADAIEGIASNVAEAPALATQQLLNLAADVRNGR